MPGTGKRGNAAGGPRGGNSPETPAPYDGPNDPRGGSRGRSPSQAGPSGPRAGSQVRAASATRGVGPILRDPARDARVGPLLRNVDFGGDAYNLYDSVSCILLCLLGVR